MRIVIKIGTNVIADEAGEITLEQMQRICADIYIARTDGCEVILVTSGAIATGKNKLPNLAGKVSKQVWATVGQPVLLAMYADIFRKKGIVFGQCLLLRDDFTDRERYDNIVRTIDGMLGAKVLPILNENDAVATEDLTVGDNDQLAAMVAVALRADKLVLMTNQKGVYTANPDTDPEAKLIERVENIDREFERMFSQEKSSLGRGGMMSKIRAAKHAVSAGIETFVVDGRESGILKKILSGVVDGTRFVSPRLPDFSLQERWLMAAKGYGQIIVDDGAVKALRAGKSLLFPGIFQVKGLFEKGQIVEVISKKGEPAAYGKINYDYRELLRLLGQKKNEGKIILDREVIHRDYMTVLQ